MSDSNFWHSSVFLVAFKKKLGSYKLNRNSLKPAILKSCDDYGLAQCVTACLFHFHRLARHCVQGMQFIHQVSLSHSRGRNTSSEGNMRSVGWLRDKTSQKHENITFRIFYSVTNNELDENVYCHLKLIYFYTGFNMLAIKNSVEHLEFLYFFRTL